MFFPWSGYFKALFFAAAITLMLQSLLCAHGPENKMTEHMKAMYRVKERIPMEYKIMGRTPVTPASESISRGKTLYMQSCMVCHGPTGKGDGPAGVALEPPPANLQDVKHSSIYGPGAKYWIIGNGTGETGMPGFKAQIEPLDRWHLVNFIYSLQEGNTEPEKPTRHHHKLP